MNTRDQLLSLLSDSVPELRGDTSSDSWPRRVNTGVALGFGFDFGDRSAFMGSINAFSAVGFRIFSVTCDSHLVFRERAHLVEDSHYLLSLQVSGRKSVEQRGRVATIGAGEFTLYDSTAPVALRVGDDYRSINIRFPKRDLAPQDRRLLDELTVETASVRNGIAPVVWTTLLGLRQCSDQIAPYADLRHSLIEMMVLMMKSRRTNEADRARPDSKLDAIKRFIRDHLSDPELSVEAVAQANYLSVRSVHKLFAEAGDTPAAWIREQRLREAKRILSDPASGLSITETAQRCGFSSIAQFSYIFRQSTGMTPTAYRASQRAD